MNDFTREELEEILSSVDDTWGENYLYHKIKSMVDNYCGHKEVVMDVDGGISLNCKKCNKLLVDI